MKESIRKLSWMVAMYYFLQGMGGNPGLHIQALQRHVKETLQFSPSQAAAFFAFLTIPWMLKPLYGFLSDFLPIFRSRRKSYFILTGLLGAISYGFVSWFDTSKDALFVFLFIAAVGFAFSDVLCDAVMVEKGQPLGATDVLQAAQWGALGIAGILVAFSKGYLAEHFTLSRSLQLSLLFPVIMVAFTILALKEERASSSGEAACEAWQGLKSAARSKPLWAAAAFLFLFDFSPNLGSVLYYYEKDALKFSDTLIGHIDTVGAVGFVVGTILFKMLAKRISSRALLHAIIASGVISTLLYLFFKDPASAYVVTALASVVNVTAFIGVLTIAAKICPKHAEGTVFALLMSVLNAGTQLGSIVGGKLYEHAGYSWLVIISAIFTAGMWFFMPLMRQKDPSS